MEAVRADRSAAVVGVLPLPCKLTCCGLSALLSVIASFAAYRLADAGSKLTVIKQEAPVPTVPAQVFVWEKTNSEAGPPVTAILVIVSVDVPVLVIVICVETVLLMSTRPNCSLAGTSLTVPFVRVIAPPPVVPGSRTDVATIANAVFVGSVEGAVYVVASPLAVAVGAVEPQVGEHGTPFCTGAHVTPLLAPSFLTVAVNCCVAFTPISTEAGDTETVIGGGTTVTLANADLVASVTEVAVSVTVGFAGTVAGAVYVVSAPLAVVVGVREPQPGEHGVPDCVRFQVTPAFAAS